MLAQNAIYHANGSFVVLGALGDNLAGQKVSLRVGQEVFVTNIDTQLTSTIHEVSTVALLALGMKTVRELRLTLSHAIHRSLPAEEVITVLIALPELRGVGGAVEDDEWEDFDDEIPPLVDDDEEDEDEDWV